MTPDLIVRRVWVKTDFYGWHCWPDAPFERAYLAEPHRHLFKVIVQVDVDHNDRDVEFHDLLEFVNEELGDVYGGMAFDPNTTSTRSCEEIAERLLAAVGERWPGRNLAVTVSEDGEVGATLELPLRE